MDAQTLPGFTPVYPRSPRPTHSPWGDPQDVREYAPGIWAVQTAGHGGFMLSRERNAAVPAYMRARAGHYEEDCDWAIVAAVFPEVFANDPGAARAMQTLANWRPDAFERFTGRTLQPGESLKRDEARHAVDHAGDWVAASAFGAWASFVREGEVGVFAKRASDGDGAWFIVPADEYAVRPRAGGFVIDPARHLRIHPPVDPHASEPEAVRPYA